MATICFKLNYIFYIWILLWNRYVTRAKTSLQIKWLWLRGFMIWPQRPPKAVVLNLGSIEPQGFAESLSGVRQGSRHRHYSPVHTTLSVTQNKFSPLVLVVTSSLAAADHATLLGFDVCAAGNLVVDLWLLWLYVICDFLLIFQSLHTYYVEQKKKVVGRIHTIWIHVYKGTMYWRNHILFFQLRRVRWMHWWSLQGSVPPIRLRTTDLRSASPLSRQ